MPARRKRNVVSGNPRYRYRYAPTPDTPPGLVNVVGVDYQSAALAHAPHDQARALLSLNAIPPDTPAAIAGGPLVRQSARTVPESSGLGMIALGLLGIALIGFRRRNIRH